MSDVWLLILIIGTYVFMLFLTMLIIVAQLMRKSGASYGIAIALVPFFIALIMLVNEYNERMSLA